MAGFVIQGNFAGAAPPPGSAAPGAPRAAPPAPPPVRFGPGAAPAGPIQQRPFGAAVPPPPRGPFGLATAAPAIQRSASGVALAVDPGVLRIDGPGQPLPEGLRRHMEAALGADFSAVRIHVGPRAASIGAVAFTAGNNLHFAPGRYQPDSVAGRQLIGHELAHVVQQRQGRVTNPFGAGAAVIRNPQLEAEADRQGRFAATMPAPQRGGVTAVALPGRPIQPMRAGTVQRMQHPFPQVNLPPMNFLTTATQQNLNKGKSDDGRLSNFDISQSMFQTYTTSTRSVIAFLKINGKYATVGQNNKAKYKKKFEGTGHVNQKGKKINFHAEDWCLQAFRDEVNQSGLSLKDYLAANYPAGDDITSTSEHVFSMRINYSSCQGCTNTIINFRSWLDRELGKTESLFRVKFLRPYDLGVTAKKRASPKAQNFISSIGMLYGNNIAVRIQPRQSALKMNSTIEKEDTIGERHKGLKFVLNSIELAHLVKTWAQLGVNRRGRVKPGTTKPVGIVKPSSKGSTGFHFCNAPTGSGTRCRRHVAKAGAKCHSHRT